MLQTVSRMRPVEYGVEFSAELLLVGSWFPPTLVSSSRPSKEWSDEFGGPVVQELPLLQVKRSSVPGLQSSNSFLPEPSDLPKPPWHHGKP